jgi:hypothetical protein
LLMEGLRLLDESQREGGGETAVESAAADAGPVASGGPRSGRADEEEDVLLDS